MLRTVISGVAAPAVGLVGGWTFLVATDVEASPTTAPVTASLGWLPLEPSPSSNADMPKAAPAALRNSAPGIRAADSHARTPALAGVAGPPAKTAAGVVTRDKPRSRIAQRSEGDDDDD
jgi:hypothetical protein